MKHFITVYFLASILCSCVQAEGFKFGDFFFGSDASGTIKRSSESQDLPQIEESSNTNSTIQVYSEIEFDSTTVNSTFDEEFLDLNLVNSSDSIGSLQNSSTLEEDDAKSKQSVKKQLLNSLPATSTTSSSVIAIEQGTSNSGSVQDSVDTSSANGLNATSNADELEEVVLGTTKTPEIPDEKTIFQKSIEWVEDTYTLSILIPVAAGVLFATTCIVTIAICGCMRRCCRRRRLRRKILPDSVKSLRASDRKRLLGDCSSDEEF